MLIRVAPDLTAIVRLGVLTLEDATNAPTTPDSTRRWLPPRTR